MKQIRVNANINQHLYQKVQNILQQRNLTLKSFIEKSMEELVEDYEYEMDKKAFDDLAQENATKEMLKIEKECAADGLE